MGVSARVDTPLAPLKRGSVGVGFGCVGCNYGAVDLIALRLMSVGQRKMFTGHYLVKSNT